MSAEIRAFELGLAALLIGAALFVSAPLILVLATLIWRFADQSPDIVNLHAWLARVGSALIFVMCVAGLVVGTKAVRQARRSQPLSGIAYPGLLMAMLGGCAAVVAIYGLLNTTESMVLLYK